MSVLETVKATLRGSTTSNDTNAKRSQGAYWCHDCSERIRDVDADVLEGAVPDCPECGEEMTFERSPDSAGCAC